MAEPDTRYIILNGTNCTAILETNGTEAPLWRYWGPKLAAGTMPPSNLRQERATPSFALDHDQPLSLFPTFGVGWFGQTALLAHRNGADHAQMITSCAVEQPNPQSVHFSMTDDVAGIAVLICLTLDPVSDTLAISTRLTNTGDAAIDILWLAAATTLLPPDVQMIRSYSGRHNNEFQPVEDRPSRSLWRRENRRGITSHACFPGAIVFTNSTTYGAQLAWSGNHVQTIECLDDGQYQWQMGEWLAPGEAILPPGASIDTPEMLATCSVEGENGVAQNFHAAIRARLDWPGGAMRPRPVHLNTWEGLYFKHDLETLKEMASAAVAIGIERFVLDDGWFAGRHDDTCSLGDWWPDTVKYPDGLEPLADHIIGLGMEFGLWVEPEMVNPDSDLFRAHPDWALQISGRPLLTGRNQLVLDLARGDVCTYLFDKIATLLKTLPISYLKWDHNRDLTGAGEQARYRQQVHATYALLSRLRQAFPHVEIESCAGGGGRIDAGIIRHTHRFWTSDCIDAVSRIQIQRGFLQFFPPELMGAHIGTAPAHTTGRSQSMAFRAAVALPGHFGVELDIRKLDAVDKEGLKNWIEIYKSNRDQMHSGGVWWGSSNDSVHWQAHGDNQNLLLLVYRTHPTAQRYGPTVALTMLDTKIDYLVERMVVEQPSPHSPRTSRIDVAMRQGGVRVHGQWLAAHGFSVPQMLGEDCALFRITAIES